MVEVKGKMKISEIAKRLGLPESRIRYYEKRGLIKIDRDTSGHRDFSQKDLAWLEFILRLKNTGMPIKEIETFASLRYQGDETVSERLEILRKHKRRVEEQIIRWEDYLENLNEKIGIYEGMIKENGS